MFLYGFKMTNPASAEYPDEAVILGYGPVKPGAVIEQLHHIVEVLACLVHVVAVVKLTVGRFDLECDIRMVVRCWKIGSVDMDDKAEIRAGFKPVHILTRPFEFILVGVMWYPVESLPDFSRGFFDGEGPSCRRTAHNWVVLKLGFAFKISGLRNAGAYTIVLKNCMIWAPVS